MSRHVIDPDRVRQGRPPRGLNAPYLNTAATIRDAIRSGDLKPGDRIVRADVIAQLGVHRNTLRKALQVLQCEGWVHMLGTGGTWVAAKENHPRI